MRGAHRVAGGYVGVRPGSLSTALHRAGPFGGTIADDDLWQAARPSPCLGSRRSVEKPALILLAVAAFFVAAEVFQLLWNSTLPEAFGLKRVRYWIAFRLLLIASLVTSGSLLKLNISL